MTITVKASELHAGDLLKLPGGIGVIHRLPLQKHRGDRFTVYFYIQKGEISQVEYAADEPVELVRQWP